MTSEITVLLASATAIALVHTLVGPDHYLPFVALAKARRWSLGKTLWITSLCGLGHVASSIALGLVGIASGMALQRLELVESGRGAIAAWLLMAFGLCYAAWGLMRLLRGRPHVHTHSHSRGEEHQHPHTHRAGHSHPHGEGTLTPWLLFVVFVFGPCEPLIPLLMYPAAATSLAAAALVAAVFGTVTIAAMAGMVAALSFGAKLVPAERLGRYSHVLAGSAIFLCGMMIKFGL